jgi:hypothetical protein
MSYRWTWRVYARMAGIQLAICGFSLLVIAAVGAAFGRCWISWPSAGWLVGLPLAGWLVCFLADRVIWFSIDHYAPKDCPHCGKRIDKVEWVP